MSGIFQEHCYLSRKQVLLIILHIQNDKKHSINGKHEDIKKTPGAQPPKRCSLNCLGPFALMVELGNVTFMDFSHRPVLDLGFFFQVQNWLMGKSGLIRISQCVASTSLVHCPQPTHHHRTHNLQPDEVYIILFCLFSDIFCFCFFSLCLALAAATGSK
jgi:hypothetical protein